MMMILTEITGINDIIANNIIIMLLAVTTTQMLSPRPDRVSEMPVGVQGWVITYTLYILLYVN